MERTANSGVGLRGLGWLLLYGLAVFLGGALIAPWIYEGTQRLAESWPTFQGLAAQPFSRYVHRSVLVLALGGAWPLARLWGLRSLHDVGLRRPTGQRAALARGVLAGCGVAALAGGTMLLSGAREFEVSGTVARLIVRLAQYASTGLTVGLLEEVLFRGILYGGLRRLGRWPLAMAASSLLYALCHMLGKATVPATVVWSSGLAAVVEMLRGPLLVQWWSPALFNLCLVGCILAWTYRASGNLLLPISLHASWIFSLKTFGLFTRAGQAANPGVEASGRLLESWFLFGALLLLPALIRGAVARRAPAPTSPCPPPSRAC